jgi:hypothetical protein
LRKLQGPIGQRKTSLHPEFVTWQRVAEEERLSTRCALRARHAGGTLCSAAGVFKGSGGTAADVTSVPADRAMPSMGLGEVCGQVCKGREQRAPHRNELAWPGPYFIAWLEEMRLAVVVTRSKYARTPRAVTTIDQKDETEEHTGDGICSACSRSALSPRRSLSPSRQKNCQLGVLCHLIPP